MSNLPFSTSTDAERLDRLNSIVWNEESLVPLPPQAVIEFCSRARQPDVCIRELDELVESEPSLTIELLRHVNSASYGLRHQIDSVERAISLLGIPASTMILLTKALSNAVGNIESPLVSSLNFRRESLERAHFAREIARTFGLNTGVTYTSAMLVDILLPLLTQQHEKEYRRYLSNDRYHSIIEFEFETFGWTHAELAAKTMLKWGFPHSLALSVMQHHESPEKLLVSRPQIPELFPVTCSALLMDVLRQSTDGMTRLFDLQHIDNRFQVVTLAKQVDQTLLDSAGFTRHPLTLMERMQNAMLSQIEVRRQQILVPGRQFGNYVLEEKIRESTMGSIFKSRHIHLRRPAALKILRADRTNALSISQFETEVQHTSELRHPNTVTIFDFGRTPEDLFYYAMELVEGLTLTELTKLAGPLPDGRVISILTQVCGALSEAHDSDLIHRDIKPENIMISLQCHRPDHITLLDFGLVTTSLSFSKKTAEPNTLVGTPLYISPEAVEGRKPVTAKSDLYSLGAVGYYLLTGKPVFSGRTIEEILTQHLKTPAPEPTCPKNPNISNGLKKLIRQCLEKQPGKRPQSALSMIDCLNKIIPEEPWTPQQGQAWWTEFNGKQSTLKSANRMPHNMNQSDLEAAEKTVQI